MSAPVRVAGHFGEWLQGRMGPDGPVVLVTLACDVAGVTATVRPSETFQVSGCPAVSTEVGHRFLAALGVDAPKAAIHIASALPPGAGTGVSTASLLALAQAAGVRATADQLSSACLGTEGAVDPLMVDERDGVLWASRAAQVVRQVTRPPAFDVLAGLFGPATPTDAADDNFADISDLIALWEDAAQSRDRLGAVASDAAARTTRLRGPEGDPMADLASELGALGWIRGHTGSARGLLFAPGDVPKSGLEQLREAGMTNTFVFQTGRQP